MKYKIHLKRFIHWLVTKRKCPKSCKYLDIVEGIWPKTRCRRFNVDLKETGKMNPMASLGYSSFRYLYSHSKLISYLGPLTTEQCQLEKGWKS